jgi:hypothetical protein
MSSYPTTKWKALSGDALYSKVTVWKMSEEKKEEKPIDKKPSKQEEKPEPVEESPAKEKPWWKFW